MKTSTMAVGFIQILDLSHFHPSMNQAFMKAVVAIAATAHHCAIAGQFHLSGFEDRDTLEADVPHLQPSTTGDLFGDGANGGCRLDTCFTTNVLTTFNHYMLLYFLQMGGQNCKNSSILSQFNSPRSELCKHVTWTRNSGSYTMILLSETSDVWGFICMSLKMRYYGIPPDIFYYAFIILKICWYPRSCHVFWKHRATDSTDQPTLNHQRDWRPDI